MKRALLFVIALCVVNAMVPRERRALNSEDATSAKTEPKIRCATQTPCGWILYEPGTTVVELTVSNNYCVCPEDETCTKHVESDNLSKSLRCEKHTD